MPAPAATPVKIWSKSPFSNWLLEKAWTPTDGFRKEPIQSTSMFDVHQARVAATRLSRNPSQRVKLDSGHQCNQIPRADKYQSPQPENSRA